MTDRTRPLLIPIILASATVGAFICALGCFAGMLTTGVAP